MDTLTITKKLKKVGFPTKQAEAIAFIQNGYHKSLATKESLEQVEKHLSGEIVQVEKRLSGEIALTRGEIIQVEKRLSGEITSLDRTIRVQSRITNAIFVALGLFIAYATLFRG